MLFLAPCLNPTTRPIFERKNCQNRKTTRTLQHIHIYMYIYIYLSLSLSPPYPSLPPCRLKIASLTRHGLLNTRSSLKTRLEATSRVFLSWGVFRFALIMKTVRPRIIASEFSHHFMFVVTVIGKLESKPNRSRIVNAIFRMFCAINDWQKKKVLRTLTALGWVNIKVLHMHEVNYPMRILGVSGLATQSKNGIATHNRLKRRSWPQVTTLSNWGEVLSSKICLDLQNYAKVYHNST